MQRGGGGWETSDMGRIGVRFYVTRYVRKLKEGRERTVMDCLVRVG